jgi:DNA invertase Pin-like site-specific DNA recombinase
MPRQRSRKVAQPQARAAQYLRMSTEEQALSLGFQKDAIAAYAAARDMTIVRTYEDAGRSGLTIDGRSGLQALIADVVAGTADFGILLVYDISRWGRFQDVDAGAYYEYICRKAGIEIVYCQEPFGNDRSPLGTLLKTMKRVMAAEYSRELSVKIFAAQSRASLLGHRQGGGAGLGLRRRALGPGDGFGPRYIGGQRPGPGGAHGRGVHSDPRIQTSSGRRVASMWISFR